MTDQLIRTAQELAPTLVERAAVDEAARRIPEATITDLRSTGLFRVLLAERSGGFETDLATHIEVVSAVAEGCPSTAWVVGVAHAHSWLVGHFPARAQDEVYGVDPDALVAGVLAVRGEVERTDGGWLLSGRWPFGSGIERAGWALLGARDTTGGETPAEGLFLLPVDDIDIADDWHVSGLKATGSCTIGADAVFVPDHRFASMAAIATGTSPGAALHGSPLHRSAMMPVLTIALTGPALGAGRAALRVFAEQIEGRTATHADVLQAELPATHRLMAEAATSVNHAELLLQDGAAVIDDLARADQPMDLKRRARMRMDCAAAVRCCLEAAQMLYLATGGRGLRTTNPLAGLVGDLQAMNMHALLNLEAAKELYGRVLLGLAPETARV